MAEEPDVIRQEIEQTRSSLTGKIETLENEVRDTVQTAKATVEETIQTAKATVQETIDTVKGTVQGTVESVKQTFDVPYQVRRHPWAMFGASCLAGLAVGSLLPPRRQMAGWARSHLGHPESYRGPQQAAAASTTTHPPAEAWPQSVRTEESRPGWLEWVTNQFHDEIQQVKGMAKQVEGKVQKGVGNVQDAADGAADVADDTAGRTSDRR